MPDLRPTLLLILDGWGQAPDGPGNAVARACTPTLDRLRAEYPGTLLDCSGRAVGLPSGFMGNSEVGHMNIGAGRVVYQDMTRIDIAVEEGRFADNPAIAGALAAARETGGRLHLMGLVSDGGVHSHQNHIHALLAAAKDAGVPAVVHAFLDGRDTPPDSGAGYLEQLAAEMRRLGWGEIATVMGRYWAMDRDSHWERNERAYAAMTVGRGKAVEDPVAAVRDAYAAKEFDEFVEPRVVTREGRPVALLADGDAVFFFNFRADRARQIVRALFDPEFTGFAREAFPRLHVATMTRYESSFPLPVAFPKEEIADTLGQVVSELGLTQLRIAETEKYAHVTYFLNCGREEPFPGEERVLTPSPREVATYDLKPEMSVFEVARRFRERWGKGGISLAVCNLANLDMVGHTGMLTAAIAACQAVDTAVADIVGAVRASGGRVLLTADHGNSEEMIDSRGGPHTAHTLNQVPLVLLDDDWKGRTLRPGKLADIAPTILDLWGVERPAAMTGKSLLGEGQ
ncbi:MAG: 2,3-bisphosphoglycerate-independent phosphoglycerate mutase [Thermodesulfobacteriota bacterium]